VVIQARHVTADVIRIQTENDLDCFHSVTIVPLTKFVKLQFFMVALSNRADHYIFAL